MDQHGDPSPACATGEHEIDLEVVKHVEAKQGFVLLPRRWVVERTSGWLASHRGLARGYERPGKTLAICHWVADLGIMIERFFDGSAQQVLRAKTLTESIPSD